MIRVVRGRDLTVGDRIVWCGKPHRITRLVDGEPEGRGRAVTRSIFLDGFASDEPALAVLDHWEVETAA